MNIYHVFFSLKDGASDMKFVSALDDWLGYLKGEGKLETWRLMRRKLGFSPDSLGEFHIMIEFEGLAELDDAFSIAASRSGEAEAKHYGVNSMVKSVNFALYRDFPDPERKTGGELF